MRLIFVLAASPATRNCLTNFKVRGPMFNGTPHNMFNIFMTVIPFPINLSKTCRFRCRNQEKRVTNRNDAKNANCDNLKFFKVRRWVKGPYHNPSTHSFCLYPPRRSVHQRVFSRFRRRHSNGSGIFITFEKRLC